jgi:nucleotide-binding universal stress UspA family protein
MSNILFGEDFSNSSHEAFKFLRKICSERKGSDLEATLLHVHEQSNLEMLLKVASMEKINRIEKSEKERLEELAELLSADMKIRPCVDIRRGNQVKEFLNAIKDNGSLMVLIGAQGLRWSEQYRIGETAFRIAEESPVPVLVIPLDKMKYPF